MYNGVQGETPKYTGVLQARLQNMLEFCRRQAC
jgi:hypothetical protein